MVKVWTPEKKRLCDPQRGFDLDSPQTAPPADRREPWERTATESSKAFEAFKIYRDLEKRMFTKVAERLNCAVSNVTRWALHYRWKDRVLDYDIREDELHREAMARGRREMRERHVKLGMLPQSISAHALAEWQAKLAAGTQLNLSAGEITQLMEVGSKLERPARGEDRDSKFTKIIVNIGEYKDEQEYEETLMGSKAGTIN